MLPPSLPSLGQKLQSSGVTHTIQTELDEVRKWGLLQHPAQLAHITRALAPVAPAGGSYRPVRYCLQRRAQLTHQSMQLGSGRSGSGAHLQIVRLEGWLRTVGVASASQAPSSPAAVRQGMREPLKSLWAARKRTGPANPRPQRCGEPDGTSNG